MGAKHGGKHTPLNMGLAADIVNKLREVCSTVDGYAVYQKGWEDKRVAKHMRVACGSVRHRRRQLFGMLFKAPVAKPVAPPSAPLIPPPLAASQSELELECMLLRVLSGRAFIQELGRAVVEGMRAAPASDLMRQPATPGEMLRVVNQAIADGTIVKG